jgi:hypothetical protein
MLERFALAALVAIAMSIELAQARNMRSDVPPCTMGNPVAATCDCGTADNGRPVLCHAGNGATPTGLAPISGLPTPRELHSCSEKTCSLQHRKNP